MKYSSVQYIADPYSAMQYSSVPCSTVQYSTGKRLASTTPVNYATWDARPATYTALHTLHCTAHAALHCTRCTALHTLHRTAHAALHCTAHAAMQCNALIFTALHPSSLVLHCRAEHCTALHISALLPAGLGHFSLFTSC